MRRALIIAVAVVVAALAVWYFLARDGGEAESGYEFALVERGDLENVISCTGTLSAVGTVEVGTQVSGTMDRVLVDYNESVRRGQVLAVLDTTMLSASVRDARGGLLRAQAQYSQAQRLYERDSGLYEAGLISDEEVLDSETAKESSRASLLSAEASHDRSRANLRYAVIRSPIDGTVIMRNVEPGQTVAASFSTPTLFVIAEDLSEMEIHALVDESDIGAIKVGQTVRFTVEAYLDDMFHGTVRQIWLQPQTVQNVVNYTVVVDAPNEKGLLFPGMTATTDFMIDERHDVLLLPNSALRFRPSPEMMEEFRAAMSERYAAMPDSQKRAMEERTGRLGGGERPGGFGGGPPSGASGGPPGMSFGNNGGSASDAVRLWYLDDRGRLSVARVTTGATDGRMTEIVSGEGIEEGVKIIVEVVEQDERGSTAQRALRRGL